jgi:hypothetical protein
MSARTLKACAAVVDSPAREARNKKIHNETVSH